MEYIEGNTGKWEYVIGLEIHAQISSKSKLFSGSSTLFAASPNSQVSYVDAAMPGMLPVLNKHCVYQAIKTGLVLKAKINKYSVFDRKNYFYADLPQGYQISQFYYPIVQDGMIEIPTSTGDLKTIRINRLHLEQDAGKSIHDQSPYYSLIDLNRAGIGLMEIVTEPDISSPEEAAEFVKKLRNLLRYIGSCDGDMEKGSMRCDANISVRRIGEALGTRCEIKNINSIRNIIKAIEFEAKRQVDLLESGETIIQETRLFNVDSCETKTMRLKEEALDYRYFPDPDLLPLIIPDELINELKASLPELPDQKIEKYIKKFGLSQYDAGIIVSDEAVAEYFEKAANECNPKMLTNWLITELFGQLNKASIGIRECKITPSDFAKLIKLIEHDTISGKIAKTVFEIMFETGKAPDKIVEEKRLVQISDNKILNTVIDEVIAENSKSVKCYKSGKDKLFGFFVGQVMKKTECKANPTLVNKLLKDKLDS
ncbi:Asp-tRNA(Asn)/Glu-tRNA(Gln) amidotransferase subunit GatB [Rickettsia prowazekii]|uniref:Aspartyl/glutamyl-tRNA(Asn/Gln) amidotransferase subunit B n=2 Tax=Rickettsia prowazekii TaxID=782 RepID=GATB_RICPR|nr:Asp-tRNA(Asn)/Glu-tRNA(Gln) amidotransferase subunit GatB [Rickettsia prowazekii]Q9ZE11.1 RecName: Full=Aspartyl/glutamyl-tRNA(Asn/Gln) amidotransferase subunit B; Short=Asp/Glu-ADT subunit B [Rickettsia prowazekii str. Madrid E]EOB10044.1 Amino acid ABC transporter substrate binding protein [Rickettsia prowazekii str. GvF12]ADE29661.1 Glutamyl-tRNA(Gln)amidotransferase subunit B [Rickettsia prowazekii str. Rp22]AFE48973.1 aspartyl/glutamyl-tRNA amidotransferase subunit B [Rickettsia prowaze